MKKDKWVKELDDAIERLVDAEVDYLEDFAEENNVEVSYVLETYRDKMVYKINKITK